MIDLLVLIPREVIRDKIFPFYDVLSLVRLDSATLSQEHRPNMLCHVLHDSVVAGDTTYNRGMAVWLAKRNIHVQNIQFPKETEPEDLEIATPVMSVADSINLSFCAKLTNECVKTMISESGSLKSIALEECKWLEDDTLLAIAQHSYALEQCLLSNCPLVTDAGLACFINKCTVVDLQLLNCRQVGELSMSALVDNCISSLNISMCPLVTDADVVRFVQSSDDLLCDFILSDNDQLTDLSLLAIAEHCPTLRSLDVSHNSRWTDTGLCRVIEACQLYAFRADGCELSPTMLERLCTRVNPDLSTLCIDPCAALTEQLLEALVTRCTLMWDLKLSHTDGVNDRTLRCMGENLPSLACITLDSCPNVRLEGLRALVRGCPNLEEIHLLACPLVCDQCLIEIAEHSKGLCWLSLTDNANVTDSGVRALAQLSGTLMRMKLINTSITDDAIEYLVKCCPLITMLELEGRNVVSPSLQRLAEQRGIHMWLEGDTEVNEEIIQNAILLSKYIVMYTRFLIFIRVTSRNFFMDHFATDVLTLPL